MKIHPNQAKRWKIMTKQSPVDLCVLNNLTKQRAQQLVHYWNGYDDEENNLYYIDENITKNTTTTK